MENEKTTKRTVLESKNIKNKQILIFVKFMKFMKVIG